MAPHRRIVATSIQEIEIVVTHCRRQRVVALRSVEREHSDPSAQFEQEILWHAGLPILTRPLLR